MHTLRSLLVVASLAFSVSAGEDRRRGFEVGQTLPDIALIDLDGKEVRFSRFLGEQYVLYGWASW